MKQIKVENLSKNYGKVQALNNIDFECQAGEFLTVLGPPGAGKTTLLKTIAGLEDINSGMIYFDNDNVTDIDPRVRNVSMAFESYALYPHLSVLENIVHPLKVRGNYTDQDIQRLLAEVTTMLRIEHLMDRKTSQLSGGQRQRVGLARALIREKPNALLLDEPIAHLDATLRHWLRGELKRYLKAKSITTIYATPDYLEAMAMGDRVLVLSNGKLIQIGSPEEILYSPASAKVASFIGDPPTNIIPVNLIRKQGSIQINFEGNMIDMPNRWSKAIEEKGYEEVIIGLKPSDMVICNHKPEHGFLASVYVAEPLQRKKVITLKIGTYSLKVNASLDVEANIGDEVWVQINADKAMIFDPNTLQAIN